MRQPKFQSAARSFPALILATTAWLASMAAGAPIAAHASFLATSESKVAVEAVPASRQARPGAELPVAVVFEMAPEWHINPSEEQMLAILGGPTPFIATRIAVEPDPDSPLTAHPELIQWPEPKTIEVTFTDPPMPYPVFGGKAVAYLPVVVAEDAAPGPASMTLLLTFQACDDRQCLFPVQNMPVTFTVEITTGPTDDAGDAPTGLFDGFSHEVWAQVRTDDGGLARRVLFDLFGLNFTLDAHSTVGLSLLLLAAGLGGMLLNFTPCVLPIIPIKIMSLSQASESRAGCLTRGVSLSLGVVAFWAALGVAMASLTSLTAVNQLFHYPSFTIGIGVFIAVMALGMGGFFTVSLPQSVHRFQPKAETHGGAFFLGVMTATLSTPCTAPFMGAALGWATTQSPAVSTATFIAIGVGMALPYLVLSAMPGLVSRLPRSGPGSALVKQGMGLLLLAAAAYFIGVGVVAVAAEPGEAPSKMYWWPVTGLVAIAAAWIAYGVLRLSHSPWKRAMALALGLAVALGSLASARRLADSGPIRWVYYTPARFANALAEGKAVVMEFTAEWCLNCKALEESVLRHPRVVSLFDRGDVVPMKVDLTSPHPDGQQMLADQERQTIPLLVVFNPAGESVFKSDFYTPEQVQDAVATALGTDSR